MTARLPNCFSVFCANSVTQPKAVAQSFLFFKHYYGLSDYMDIILLVILCFAGGALGYEIPNIAQSITLYKCRMKNMELSLNPRYTSTYLKLGLCVLNGAVWVLSGMLTAYLPETVLISFLFTTAVIVTIIDIRIRIVPNELLLVMIVIGIAFQAVQFGFMAILTSAICMIAMMVFFTIVAGIIGFDKVGAGDVKLAGAMGLVLGYPNIISAMIIMCAGFVIFSVVGIVIRKLTMKSMLPFAPFMMIGMVVALASIVLQIQYL